MTAALRVEKLMSLTAQEFADSLARLGPSRHTADRTHHFVLEDGSVIIRFMPQPGVILGGLLALPRAKVSLTFQGSNDATRASFLKRFELAFQRGGG